MSSNLPLPPYEGYPGNLASSIEQYRRTQPGYTRQNQDPVSAESEPSPEPVKLRPVPSWITAWCAQHNHTEPDFTEGCWRAYPPGAVMSVPVPGNVHLFGMDFSPSNETWTTELTVHYRIRIQELHWATDPMGLMFIFRPHCWRDRLADGIEAIADHIQYLSNWVRGDG